MPRGEDTRDHPNRRVDWSRFEPGSPEELGELVRQYPDLLAQRVADDQADDRDHEY